MTATLTINKEFNGIEIGFESKPTVSVLSTLKEYGFRWHSKKRVWYAKNTADRMQIAERITAEKEENAAMIEAEPVEKENKFGVKIGDIFSASWGYEQTNNDFFQVIALVGDSSVRVREVYLPMIDSSAVGPMSEDREFAITNELLPPANYSVFIKDQEKGDLKRLKSYAADGVSNPQFAIAKFADAHYCSGNTIKVYESWYA